MRFPAVDRIESSVRPTAGRYIAIGPLRVPSPLITWNVMNAAHPLEVIPGTDHIAVVRGNVYYRLGASGQRELVEPAIGNSHLGEGVVPKIVEIVRVDAQRNAGATIGWASKKVWAEFSPHSQADGMVAPSPVPDVHRAVPAPSVTRSLT